LPVGDPRWIITVIYRTDQGEFDNQFHIEELGELEDIGDEAERL
jgi:hypothetical protein